MLSTRDVLRCALTKARQFWRAFAASSLQCRWSGSGRASQARPPSALTCHCLNRPLPFQINAWCTPTRSGQVLGFFLKLRETQCRQSLPLPHLDAKQVPWLRTRTCLLVEGGKLGWLPPWRCYTHLYICYTHLRKLAQHSTCPPSARPCHIFM